MMIRIEMGPGFSRTVAELGSMGKVIGRACSQGLGKGVKLAAGKVVRDYLSGQSLKRRTGSLARAIDGWLEGDFEGVVGVKSNSTVGKYAWLLSDEEKTIRPKRAKFLAIPIGEGLTPAGVARFSSPRDVPDGFFVKTGGSLLFGRKRGERGKFRAFLLGALKHFLANEWRSAQAQKRGGGRPPISLDFADAESRHVLEPAHDLSPDRLYDKQWALNVLDRVMARLRAEHANAGKEALFDRLKGSLTGQKTRTGYRETAAELEMTEGAVKVAVHRLRKRYRALLRDEIAQTVADPEAIDDEIRHLFAALSV